MITLCELISSLRQSEIRALKAQYSQKDRNNQNLRGKLLDLILKNRDVSDEYAAQLIYHCRPNSAFSHLKNRLWEDVCSVLAMQSSFNDQQLIPVRIHVAQLIHVSRVLKHRNLYRQSFELARKALDLSIVHTLVPELLILKDLFSFSYPDYWVKERTRVLSILSENVKIESERLHAATLAEMIEQRNEARHVAELELLYRTSACLQIRSIVHRSMINLHLRNRDNEKLMKECIQLYTLALNEGADHEERKRSALAFSDITKAALHVRSFDSAISFGKAGLQFLDNDLLMKIDSYENLLVAYLNTSQIREASDMITEIEAIFSVSMQLDHRKLFFSYLKCWHLYLSKDYKGCLRTISRLPSFPKEKESWHAGFYILELLSLLASETFFQIDYRNEAFRKFQTRHEMKEIRPLDLTFRSFKIFIDSDYEKKPVQLFLQKEIERQGEDTDYCKLRVIPIADTLLKAFSGSD